MRSVASLRTSLAFMAAVMATFTLSAGDMSIPITNAEVLIRSTQRDVPVLGVFVELRRHGDRVDLDRERQRLPHLEVPGMPHDAAEPEVRRVAADLVRVGLPRLGVDPPQQRFEAD